MARLVYFNGVPNRFEDDGSQTVMDDELTQMFEWDANNHLIYHGLAQPGSVTTDAVWLIKKFTNDANGNPTAIQYANGSKGFDQTWSTRASQAYS